MVQIQRKYISTPINYGHSHLLYELYSSARSTLKATRYYDQKGACLSEMPQERWEICDLTTSYIHMDSSIRVGVKWCIMGNDVLRVCLVAVALDVCVCSHHHYGDTSLFFLQCTLWKVSHFFYHSPFLMVTHGNALKKCCH